MKNREKYAQEIIDILLDFDRELEEFGIGVEESSGKPKKCKCMSCGECLLENRKYSCDLGIWLNEECKDDSGSIKQVITYLNGKTEKHFRPTNKATKRTINARLNEGYTLEDFQKVIDIKVAEWTGTEYEKYLNPETLFGNKMDKYLNQPVQKPPEDKRSSKWGD